jgi:predicted adenylyl cyclase CyaB
MSAEPTAGTDSDRSQEREIKIAVEGLDTLRERLVELEAERVAPSAFEDNWLLDRDGEMASGKRTLRVRIDRNGARLTYKGPPEFHGDVKVRIEHETRVEDGKALMAILESLGYRVSTRYQKHREEWLLGSVTVALDHTPIGDYAEFEGDSAEKVAQRCGFDPKDAERRTYPEIYADHHRENPDSPPDMVFP